MSPLLRQIKRTQHYPEYFYWSHVHVGNLIRMTFKFIYRILIVVFSGRPLHIPDICFFVCFFLHRKEQYTLFLMSPFTRFCIRFENFVMTLFQMESVNHCLNGQWSMAWWSMWISFLDGNDTFFTPVWTILHQRHMWQISGMLLSTAQYYSMLTLSLTAEGLSMFIVTRRSGSEVKEVWIV